MAQTNQQNNGKQQTPAAVVISLTDRSDSEQLEALKKVAVENGVQEMHIVTSEQLAMQAERAGLHEEAAAIRGQQFDNSLTGKVKNLTKYSPTVGDLLITGIIVGGVLLLWEGARYLLRDTVDLPGFIKYGNTAGPKKVSVR